MKSQSVSETTPTNPRIVRFDRRVLLRSAEHIISAMAVHSRSTR